MRSECSTAHLEKDEWRRRSLIRLTQTVVATSLAWLAAGPTRADLVDDHIVAQASQVDAYFQSQMTRQHIPGLSVAVVHNGTLLLERSYGLANVELSVPTSPSTVYAIGSVTKQFTATATMMLVEEGKVSLDAKITSYLSNLPATWSDVTVRHLLTHTSGIPDYISDAYDSFIKTAREDATKQYVLSLVRDKPLKFRPGAKWSYSNTDYFLLGMIIEHVSGSTYAAFLAERIFQPLQMSATRVNDLAAIIPDRATGYTLSSSNRVANAPPWGPAWLYAAGGLLSSAEDLAKWDAALYTEVLLKRSSLELMWTPAQLNSGRPAVVMDAPFQGDNSGFGWFITHYQRKNSILRHNGGVAGFRSAVCRYLDDKVTTIILSNSESADGLGLADGLHQVVTRDLPASAP